MSAFIEAMKARERIAWEEVDGVKVGYKKMTINETAEYVKQYAACEGVEAMAALFAEHVVGEDGNQAFTVEEMSDVMSADDLEKMVDRFHELNGIGIEPGEAEKN